MNRIEDFHTSIDGVPHLAITDYADAVGISPGGVRYLITEGNVLRLLKSTRVGLHTYIPTSEIFDFPILEAGRYTPSDAVYHHYYNPHSMSYRGIYKCLECTSFPGHTSYGDVARMYSLCKSNITRIRKNLATFGKPESFGGSAYGNRMPVTGFPYSLLLRYLQKESNKLDAPVHTDEEYEKRMKMMRKMIMDSAPHSTLILYCITYSLTFSDLALLLTEQEVYNDDADESVIDSINIPEKTIIGGR